MGTNYYARIIPQEEDKQKLINAINNNQYDIIENLTSELYGRRNQYTCKGSVIHLGKRSGGWKFLWNPNIIKMWSSEYEEFVIDYVYPLTKEGIKNFVMRKDVIIQDEYGHTIGKEGFLNMAFTWCLDGLDSKSYEETKEPIERHHESLEIINKWKELGYRVEYYDFYNDNLRFSSSTDFC